MTAPADNAGRAVFDEAYLPLLTEAHLADYQSVMTARQGTSLIKPGLGRRERIRLELSAPDGTAQTMFLKRYAQSAAAEQEWRAVSAVRAAGVATMEPVGMGTGPAGGFVMVTAVPGEALSRCMGDLLARHGRDEAAMTALAEGLGRLIGTLHAAGLAHRDFYTAHVVCRRRRDGFDLYLIDLARVFRPRWRKWRWWAKDLAQLKFSLPPEWAGRYWPVVRSTYEGRRGDALPRTVPPVIERRVRRLRRRCKPAGGGQGR